MLFLMSFLPDVNTVRQHSAIPTETLGNLESRATAFFKYLRRRSSLAIGVGSKVFESMQYLELHQVEYRVDYGLGAEGLALYV